MRINWTFSKQNDGRTVPVTECGYDIGGVPAMARFHGHLSEGLCKHMLETYRRNERNAKA